MNNLPKGWNLLLLNQICDLQNGYAFKSNDYVNVSNTLNCRMSNIRPNGVFDLEHNQKFLPDSYTEKYKQYLLKDGDVIIAMTDMATEAKILGVPTIVETQGKKLLLNQRVGKLIIKKPELIYFPYLKYVLNREKVKKYFLKFAGGGLQINLGKEDILSVKVPIPPLEEQKRIAEILDRSQFLISKRQEAIALLDSLTQAIFIEMFGDPVKNPKGWKTIVLGDVITSASDGPHVSPKYADSGIPFLSTRHIQRGKINWTDLKFISLDEAEIQWKKCRPQRGDILYTKGGTTGIAATVDFDEPFAVWVHVALLKTDKNKVEPKWLENMLNCAFCYQQSQRLTHGIANRDLGLKRMVGIEMFLPPLPLQKEFAQRVEAVEKLKATHRASLTELQALFASLQHRAFRGEL